MESPANRPRITTNLPFNRPLLITVETELADGRLPDGAVKVIDSAGNSVPVEVGVSTREGSTTLEVKPTTVIPPGDYTFVFDDGVRSKSGRSVFGGLSLGVSTDRA